MRLTSALQIFNFEKSSSVKWEENWLTSDIKLFDVKLEIWGNGQVWTNWAYNIKIRFRISFWILTAILYKQTKLFLKMR